MNGGANRIPCCVPFCRRTVAREAITPNTEFLCRRHWALVPKSLKRRKRQSERVAERSDARFRAHYSANNCSSTEIELSRALAAMALARAVWARCKRTVIEKAVGL